MIISFVNQKGGVGKTTTAINLAIGLKKKNYNLVFIDADPQGSAVQWHAIEGNKSLYYLYVGEKIDFYTIWSGFYLTKNGYGHKQESLPYTEQ